MAVIGPGYLNDTVFLRWLQGKTTGGLASAAPRRSIPERPHPARLRHHPRAGVRSRWLMDSFEGKDLERLMERMEVLERSRTARRTPYEERVEDAIVVVLEVLRSNLLERAGPLSAAPAQ